MTLPARPIRTIVALAVAGPLVLAGCGRSDDSAAPPPLSSTDTVESPPAAPAGDVPAAGAGDTASPVAIEVTPRPGSRDVRNNSTVTVTAKGGTLSDVAVVDGKGRHITGAFDGARVTWRAADPLRIDTRYEVRVRARDTAGAPVVRTSTFETAKVPVSDKLQILTVQPADGATVGVAHPLVVGFDRPVQDRKTVQSALNVITDAPVRGAWYWIDDQYVHYRPQAFWPSGTKVTLRTKLAGVRLGDGTAGGADRSVSFDIARRQVLTVDVTRHKLKVVREGKVIRTFDVSTGKKGWETRNGVKVLMGKDREKDWTNEEIGAEEEYSYHSDYAMRMTNSGEFIHDAPWNKGNIGEANTSHGCVGLDPKDMAWLFGQSIVGDPIIVRGSPRPYNDLINRFADWNIPWTKWSAGNAAG